MRVLVLGSGGREHALVRALRASPSVTEVHAAPGSAGIGLEALCHSVDPADHDALIRLVKTKAFDLVVVGPEAYLAQGIADRLRQEAVAVVGPSLMGSQLESSKIFSKKFMEDAGVPTARFFIVENPEETLQAARNFQPPYVLKADGLCAGKGVVLCQSLQELESTAWEFFVEKKLGRAGEKALLEEFQPGWELSYLILTNGHEYQALPLAQDHKRVFDDDKGPNTGGMGTVAPLKISAELNARIQEEILAPSVKQLSAKGLLYRGVLYVGLMITEQGPKVIEYNVRFGDPEAQVILPLLDGDWGQVFSALAKGDVLPLKWKNLYSACVVMAAPGYPEDPKKGVAFEGDVEKHTASSYFLHAGTARSPEGQWSTNGGRVLNAVAVGSSLSEALKNAYQQAKAVSWNGMRMRSDIGRKAQT